MREAADCEEQELLLRLFTQNAGALFIMVQIDPTRMQRDASQGKTGLLIANIYYHTYTIALAIFLRNEKCTVRFFVVVVGQEQMVHLPYIF